MAAEIKKPLDILSSTTEIATETSERTWTERTFGKMEQGSVRGNIFLMTLSTVGSSFFFLPFYAKQLGIGTMILLLAFPGLISYYASCKLYYGFKMTKAKTYDECMKGVLGPKFGYLSNIIIFLHTFSSVVSTWIVLKTIIDDSIIIIFKLFNSNSPGRFDITYIKTIIGGITYTIGFYTVVMIILFLSSLSSKIERLKSISIIGIGIIFYMVIVFGILSPQYYNHYNAIEVIEIEYFKWDNIGFLKAYGTCLFLYVNQYSIIPICNSIKRVTSKRINKVLYRTLGFCFILYLIVLFIGYFSWPNYGTLKANIDNKDTDKKWDDLFIIREAIDIKFDYYITIGKLFFGLYLIIGMIVKGYFFLIYFNQLLNNTINIIKGNKIQLIEANHLDETIIKRETQMKMGKVVQIDRSKAEFQVEIEIEPIEEEENEEDENTIDQSEIKDTTQEKQSQFKKNAINFIFLTIIMLITAAVTKNLKDFLSIAGGFVSTMEIIVFPSLMIFAIDKLNPILGKIEKPVLLFFSILLTLFGAFTAITISYVTITKAK